MLKTEQILNAKFTPISKGTYSAEEVDAFLKAVAQSYDQLANEKNELIKKISILADKIESYRNDEEAIKLSLLDAHRMAETISKNATIKSDTLIGDAETRAQLIVDGANRQANKTIEEAKEQAKGIVENAKETVASLTERAQKETDDAIASARAKAAVIVADAKDEADRIVSSSKDAYEFYTSELKRIQTATSEFKATIKVLCNNQLAVAESIPDTITVPLAYEGSKFEDEKEEAVEADETEIVIDSEDIISELDEEIDVIENSAEETEEAEAVEELIEEPAEAEEESAEEEIEIAESEEDDDDFIEIDDDEDLFSIIDNFDEMLTDSISDNLDDIVVSAPAEESAETEAVNEEAAAADENEEDVFEGFKIDLDSLGLDDNNDDEDDDITSLFDSMFDD